MLNDDALKAAAEALSEHYEGDGWGYFGGAAEAAVAAAAPILLAEKDAEIKRLRERVTALSMKATGIAPLRIAETAPEEPTDVS